MKKIENSKVLVTGGAGFIGSNIIETLLEQNNEVTCLDNFSTGKRENISPFSNYSNFLLMEGDIRNLNDCLKACENQNIVLHQAALGSVPRSINDPITSNAVNVSGFLNMLVAARDCKVRRFVYAASSSTYGDHPDLPKVEDKIGKPLSPYAVTKYVNELYADVFSKLYDMEIIGLRYFNVFGPKQDPNGAYAAVIPKFINLLMNHESPLINGNGSHSRDFTFVENVVQANQLAAMCALPQGVSSIYNVACSERTDLNELIANLKEFLSAYDAKVGQIEAKYGENRVGDVLHSLASIEKANSLLGYVPSVTVKEGLRKTVDWFWNANKQE